MPQPSTKDRTLNTLKANPSRKFSTKELSSLIKCQDNTLVKNLKFLRDEGEPVFRESAKSPKGANYSLWYYDGSCLVKYGETDISECDCKACGASAFWSTDTRKKSGGKWITISRVCDCGEVIKL